VAGDKQLTKETTMKLSVVKIKRCGMELYSVRLNGQEKSTAFSKEAAITRMYAIKREMES